MIDTLTALVLFPWKRNKSVIRSSSTGSYPYPRTHTTLMVIPSTRPPPPPQPTKVFVGARRRPPLNRACPPIPESKSNESIMSHASRISEKQKEQAKEEEEEANDLVIENRSAVDSLLRLDANSNINSNCSIVAKSLKIEKKKMSSAPRSPLMSVAHSVKSKFSKITHLGRNSSESSSSAIKTSQSFSGVRQPKTIPKRIDQNANRVIKSSSMDVSQPSTSKVSIPQDPTPLIDDKIEEVSETGLIHKSELAPSKPMEHVCVKLEEDVLVVTKEFDEKYPGQKRSVSPDPPIFEDVSVKVDEPVNVEVVEQAAKETVVMFDANANPKTPGPTRRVTSPDRFVLTVKTPEALRKHKTLIIEERPADQEIQCVTMKTVKVKEIKVKEEVYEEPTPPEKFILKVKTPEALRRHHTFTIRDKSPEQIEEERKSRIAKSHSDVHVSKKAKKLVKQKSEPEKFVSPERFILTVKTPEALRKHKTLVIGEKEAVPEPIVHTEVQEEEVTKKAEKKIKRSESAKVDEIRDQENPTKFVMIMKTPEALRRHHTFTVGDRPKSPDYPYIEEGEITEPIATVGPPAERKRKEEAKEAKRKEWENYDKPPEKKFILTTTTPITLRKYQTFVVEPKDEKKVATSTSADAVTMTTKKNKKIERSESTDSKKHSYLRRLQFELFRGRSRERGSERKEKRQKSLDERKPQSTQKYVLSTTTPIMMRKYQTFSIVDTKAEAPENTNLESIAAAYRKEKSFDDEKTTSPVKTSDFYSITATTPLAKRRSPPQEEDRASFSPHSRKELSPEPRKLFVMGGRRSTTPNDERKPMEPPRNLNLDRSQSDNAEQLEEQKSTMSGDLTSPEEEIPMDTNLTPTTDEVHVISRKIEGLMASPIEEEPEGLTSSIRDVSIKDEVPQQRAAPVFTPPTPPKEQFPFTMTKSTSTSSAESTSRAKPTQLPIMRAIPVIDPMHIVELKPDEHKKSGKKESSHKSQIASKSLRNAGKMLTPSFLRKDRKASKKKVYLKTTTTGREHISEKIDRRAPLAEGESSVVANSPLVENLPITYEKWSTKSPRPEKRFSETIPEETTVVGSGVDANANSLQSPQHVHHIQLQKQQQQHDTGLIDDDILDQPMLVGDSFSHSSSIDCLSIHQKMNESIMSIDRSLTHDSRSANNRDRQNSNINHCQNYTRQIDVGLSDIADVKTQLQNLNKIVNELGIDSWEEEIIRLRRENEQLRRQLAEKDATIAALQSQTISS
ncbi:unnamed protein product [Caenorhabditis bovis]|uniref:Uncharacterized protein n=1 Tax=Caenorhabditis bovis TaxID=2654633 RepID=A0A8S1EWL4_9PELO|nr:unnamed protein product [Caenorhabditis bovis]